VETNQVIFQRSWQPLAGFQNWIR